MKKPERLVETVERLKAEVSQLTKTVNSLVGERDSAVGLVKSMSEGSTHIIAENHRLQYSLIEARNQLVLSEQRIKELTGDVEDLTAEVGELSAEVSALRRRNKGRSASDTLRLLWDSFRGR